jgi:hypothetical protein
MRRRLPIHNRFKDDILSLEHYGFPAAALPGRLCDALGLVAELSGVAADGLAHFTSGDSGASQAVARAPGGSQGIGCGLMTDLENDLLCDSSTPLDEWPCCEAIHGAPWSPS